MNKVAVIFISILILCLAVVSKALAEGNSFTVGLKSTFETWTVSKKKYPHMRGDTYWDPNTIAETESDFGFLYGSEISYRFQNFFIRGSYLSGLNDFPDVGEGARSKASLDMVFGGRSGVFIVGYRSLDASFNWGCAAVSSSGSPCAEITGHDISDIVGGISLRTSPDKSWFHGGLEMILGLKALINAFSEDKFKEDTVIAEGEFNLGYRFTRPPVAISVGYGIWGYGKPIREYTPSNNLLFDKILERFEDFGHGGVFKIAYNF